MENNKLKRWLKNRHVQLIALWWAVWTWLFLWTATTIQQAWPAVIISYIIWWLIAFFIMRQLWEIITHEPIAGSFSNIAWKYWWKLAWFVSWWNYWFLYLLVWMSELTAVWIYFNFWFPWLENWVIILWIFLLVTIINLLSVKIFWEFEFWFASIKIIAIVWMIILWWFLIFSPSWPEMVWIHNLFEHWWFFPNWVSWVFIALAFVMFSFWWLELIWIAAAETDEPKKTIPKAVNWVIYRILLFYIWAILILLMLYPWNQISPWIEDKIEAMKASPFVVIFQNIWIWAAAHILNFVIITAALSVYNSCVYSTSRMLYWLAEQKNAPKFLWKINKNWVPVNALFFSSAIMLICVGLNYIVPSKAMWILFSLVVSSLVINWGMITLTHLIFRKKNKDEELSFKSIWYPYTNYICLIFMITILWILLYLWQWISVILMPIWIIILIILYYIKERKKSS